MHKFQFHMAVVSAHILFNPLFTWILLKKIPLSTQRGREMLPRGRLEAAKAKHQRVLYLSIVRFQGQGVLWDG